jgi:diacylglycerol kinase (ATP)
VDVESPGINAYADGDFACALPAQISAVPGALHVLKRPYPTPRLSQATSAPSPPSR